MPTDRDSHSLDDRAALVEVVPPLYISLTQAAKSLPPGRRGRPVHISTILRWIVDGTVTPATGERIRLRAIRMGGRWLTTIAWLAEYGATLTPTFGGDAPVRTTMERSRSALRAAKTLDRLGI